MPTPVAAASGPPLLLLLLLLVVASRASNALHISVSPSPVRARPGSDVLLGCQLSVEGGSVDLQRLVVQWKLGEQLVAEYDDILSYGREGARLSKEGLRHGNASLLLPQVGAADTGVYMCSVIYTPNQQSGEVELRVEAPPHVSVGSTVVRVGELSAVTCNVNSFYPRSINVTWLRDRLDLGSPEMPPIQQSPNGLYNATSTHRFVPRIADADTSYSCLVQHVTLGAPIRNTFRLSVLASPQLTLQTLVTPEGLSALQCLVSGYHPSEITVQCLRDGMALPTMESQPTREPDGSFALQSVCVLSPPETNTKAAISCRVQHPALITPLEEKATWKVVSRSPFWYFLLPVLFLVVVVVALMWIKFYCIFMTEIHEAKWYSNGSRIILYCFVEGRLFDDDELRWERLSRQTHQEKDCFLELCELTASMLPPEKAAVEMWQHPLQLRRKRIMSVLILPANQSHDGDTFTCTFWRGEKFRQKRKITVKGAGGGNRRDGAVGCGGSGGQQAAGDQQALLDIQVQDHVERKQGDVGHIRGQKMQVEEMKF